MEMEIETGSKVIGQDDHASESVSSSQAIDLLPPEMLQSIYKFLSFPDVLACHMVNKKWRSAASDALKNRGNAVPLGGEYVFKHKRDLALKSLIDCVNATGAGACDFPVDKFELSLNSTNCDQSIMRQLLQDVSSFASELTFHFGLGSFPVNRTTLRSDNLPTFSKLKFLGLEIMGDAIHKNLPASSGNVVVDDGIFNFIRGIVERAPELEDMSLRIFGIVTSANTIPRCIDGFGIREKTNLLSTLKLEASFRKPLDWEALSGLGLKLKHFKVRHMENAGDGDGLNSFLASQADTLLTLVVDRNGPTDSGRTISVNFPRLPVLHKLKIEVESQYYEYARNPINFPTVCYETQLPALKELCLLKSGGGGAAKDFIKSEMTPSLTVVKLNLPWRQDDDAADTAVIQTASLFPNLKKLGIQIGLGLEQEVYTHLSWLEELTLFESERMLGSSGCWFDEVISGLPEIHRSLAIAPPSISWYSPVARLESSTCITKSLASLTNLKLLKFEGDGGDEKWAGIQFNELSGYVVKKMKSLECIDFGIRRYTPFIPVALMNELKKHVALTYRLPRHLRSAITKIEANDYFDSYSSNDSDYDISDPSSNENEVMSE